MDVRPRRSRRLVASGVIATAALLAALIPATAASAASPSIAVSPSAGTSGTNVSVSGAGWAGYDSLRISLVQGSTSNFMCEISALSTGVIPSQSCVVPPSLPQGSYTLSATDGTSTANTAFTLDPGVLVTGFDGQAAPDVAAGQAVGLTGSGFSAGSSLKATFNGATVSLSPPVTTTSVGQFSGTGIVVPSSTAAGTYPLIVKDSSNHAATVELTVFAATLKATPSAGTSGAVIGLSGSGWPADDQVRIELNQGTTQNTVCFTTTDANGLLSQSCTVPVSLAQGSYTLVGEDNSLAVSTPLTINPGVTVVGFDGQPATDAAAGQTVGLIGSGFHPGSTLKATFNGATAKLTPAVTTTTSGQFAGTGVVIPATTAAGSYPLVVKDSANHAATVHVTVYAATLKATPSAGTSGDALGLSGSGWPANDQVRIELNQGATQNTVCFITTDGNGLLSQSCAVPTSLAQGNYTLVGEDNSLAVSTPLTINPGVTVIGFDGQPAIDAAPGQAVGLTGSGFSPSSSLKATFNGATAKLTTAVTTSTSGQFSGTGIVIPAATAAGTYPLVVKDSANHAATVQLTIYAATLTPISGPLVSGTPFSVTGTGWPAHDQVRIELNQGASQNTVCFAETDGNGVLSQSCTVPTSLVQGSYSLVAEDNSLASTTPVTVAPAITVAGTNGQPEASAAPGTAAVLSGSGFAANVTITKVTVGSHAVTLSPTAVANSNGSFSGGGFTVPSVPAGVYTVTATDSAGNSGTAQLTVT